LVWRSKTRTLFRACGKRMGPASAVRHLGYFCIREIFQKPESMTTCYYRAVCCELIFKCTNHCVSCCHCVSRSQGCCDQLLIVIFSPLFKSQVQFDQPHSCNFFKRKRKGDSTRTELNHCNSKGRPWQYYNSTKLLKNSVSNWVWEGERANERKCPKEEGYVIECDSKISDYHKMGQTSDYHKI